MSALASSLPVNGKWAHGTVIDQRSSTSWKSAPLTQDIYAMEQYLDHRFQYLELIQSIWNERKMSRYVWMCSVMPNARARATHMQNVYVCSAARLGLVSDVTVSVVVVAHFSPLKSTFCYFSSHSLRALCPEYIIIFRLLRTYAKICMCSL